MVEALQLVEFNEEAGAAKLAAQTAVRTTLAGSAGALAAVAIARCRKSPIVSLQV